jgi:hypothetical protein
MGIRHESVVWVMEAFAALLTILICSLDSVSPDTPSCPDQLGLSWLWQVMLTLTAFSFASSKLYAICADIYRRAPTLVTIGMAMPFALASAITKTPTVAIQRSSTSIPSLTGSTPALYGGPAAGSRQMRPYRLGIY